MDYMQWVPVSKRRPDEELRAFREKYGRYSVREFIVYIAAAAVSTVLWYDGYGFYSSDGDEPWEDDADERDYYDDVTHWMSLPPVPAECVTVKDLGGDFTVEFDKLELILT